MLRNALAEQKENAPVSVWDADALNLVAARMQAEGVTSEAERASFCEEWFPENAVLTPHPGELSRLLNRPVSDLTGHFLATAKRLAFGSKLTYVLKDAVTLTINHTECIINTTGNNGMATGGSGDILSGVIAALAAGGMDCFTAASVGVWMHGAAGDSASRTVGASAMIARNMLQAIGLLFEEKRKEEVIDNGV
jgi:NAD(P)H-hydrate epimerase